MDRRPPGSVIHGQALPSITALTSGLSQPQPDRSPSHTHQHANSRDSGNWSAFQSKRKLEHIPALYVLHNLRNVIVQLSIVWPFFGFVDGTIHRCSSCWHCEFYPDLYILAGALGCIQRSSSCAWPESLTRSYIDSSAVSNTAGFQIQKILNADDSPTRTSAYDASQSARISCQPVVRRRTPHTK